MYVNLPFDFVFPDANFHLQDFSAGDLDARYEPSPVLAARRFNNTLEPIPEERKARGGRNTRRKREFVLDDEIDARDLEPSPVLAARRFNNTLEPIPEERRPRGGRGRSTRRKREFVLDFDLD